MRTTCSAITPRSFAWALLELGWSFWATRCSFTDLTMMSSMSVAGMRETDPAVLGGYPGIDGAADRLDRSWLHDRASMAERSSFSMRPKKPEPFHPAPLMAKPTFERLP